MTATKPKKKTPPPPPTPCICGAIHRTHIETLAPRGAHRAIALDAVEEHQLIALDGAGQRCSCGTWHTSHVEHVADIALGEVEAVAA